MNKEKFQIHWIRKERKKDQVQKKKRVPVEMLPSEELRRLIRESPDLALKIGATYELAQRAEPLKDY